MRIIFTRSTTVLILLLSIETFAQNVGIGTNAPQFLLDVNGRMRIRSGGNNTVSAGIWLNDHSQNVRSFIGMETDSTVGFYGINSNWRFLMNVNTGALKINGSEGIPGQVLQSNGGGSAPLWQSSTNALYNNTNVVQTNAVTVIDQNMPNENISGLNYSFTLSGLSKVIVTLTLRAALSNCGTCSPANIKVNFYNNATNYVSFYKQIHEGSEAETINGTRYLYLVPGTYTFQVKASVVGPSVNIDHGNMIVQVIPQ